MWLHQHSIVFVYSLIVSLQCYIIVLNRTFTQMIVGAVVNEDDDSDPSVEVSGREGWEEV